MSTVTSSVGELGDSTLPDAFFEDDSLSLNDVSPIPSTPLTKSTSHFQLSTTTTPMPNRHLVDSFSSTPLVGDEYLRRTVKFICNQLSSLKTQLTIEDKYFATCVDKYETVIDKLKEEIADLKQNPQQQVDTADSDKVLKLVKSVEEKDVEISKLRIEIQSLRNRENDEEGKFKEVASKLTNDFLSYVQKLVKHDHTALTDSGVEFDNRFESDDPQQYVEMYEKCFEAMNNKIVDDKTTQRELNSEIELLNDKIRQLSTDFDASVRQSADLKVTSCRLKSEKEELQRQLALCKTDYANCQTELTSKNEQIECLTDKARQLSAEVEVLCQQSAESGMNLCQMKSEKDDVQRELAAQTEKMGGLRNEVLKLSTEVKILNRQLDETRSMLSRTESENVQMKLDFVCQKEELIERNASVVDDLASVKLGLESKLAESSAELTERTERLMMCQKVLDTVTEEYNKSKCDFAAVKTKLECDLSDAKNQIVSLLLENDRLKSQTALQNEQIGDLKRKYDELGSEHQKLLEEFRVEASGLILDNSKLKEELENLRRALDAAGSSAERTAAKFDELKDLYSSLNVLMESKEIDLRDVESRKNSLEATLSNKESVLSKLLNNFNELTAIFADGKGPGLSIDSTESDVSEGFVQLKRRLLELSRDYIALTHKKEALLVDATNLSEMLKRKEEEVRLIGKKCESKCVQMRLTLDNFEEENKKLVARSIETDNVISQLKQRIEASDLQALKGCQDCSPLKKQVQQLKIDMVDRDSTISTLELHIQSCCEYNRKKALKYKHEMHQYKRQLETQGTFACDFGLSPKKPKCNFALKVDVGVQAGESYVHHLSGSFVERFKIGELSEKIARLEKERTVLKRLCKIRTDRIHELETKYETPPSSSRSPRASK